MAQCTCKTRLCVYCKVMQSVTPEVAPAAYHFERATDLAVTAKTVQNNRHTSWRTRSDRMQGDAQAILFEFCFHSPAERKY